MNRLGNRSVTRLTMSRREVYIFFYLCILIQPGCISEMFDNTIYKNILDILKIVCVLYLLIAELVKKQKFDFAIGLIFVFEIELLISTYIHGYDILPRIVDVGNVIGIFLLFRRCNNLFVIVKSCYMFFSISIMLNFILTILFPNGLNRSANESGRINFLGKDNSISIYFVLAIMFCVLYYMISRNLISLCICLIIILSELYYFSGAGIISIIIYIFCLICFKEKKFKHLFNPFFVSLVYALLCFMLVFLQKSVVGEVFFELLGKSSTFSDRYEYWRVGIEQFAESPFLGTGNGIVDLWGNNYYSHNAILDILLKGGFLGLILWFTMILFPLFYLWKHYYFDSIVRVICISLVPIYIIGFMEGLEDRIIFIVYIMFACLVKSFIGNHVNFIESSQV